MTQELVSAPTKSVAMELLEHRIGQSLEDYFEEHYTRRGLSQRQIAANLNVDVGSVSRWMARLGITARRGRPQKAIL